MSNPYTIREAADILLRPNNNNKETAAKITPNGHPVDLLGVVVSIVKTPSSSSRLQPAAGSTSSKVEIWITDQSLSPEENACVVLRGSAEISKVESHRLQTGNLVRFNGVNLQKPSQTGENTYYFTYSYDNPEPGMKWYCFNNNDTVRVGDTTTAAAAEGNNNNNHHNRIPETMQTLPKRIQDLKKYWEMMDSNENGGGGGGGRLSPLPCRFRTLSELQSSTGLLSNIAIRVQQHEVIQPITSTKARPMKKRRFSTTKNTSAVISMGFATVVDSSSQPDGDGGGVIMTLIDTDNRFADKLKEAKGTKKVLVINNVFTKKQSEVLGDNCVLGEVVLVPSKNSVVAWELFKDQDKKEKDHSMLQDDSVPSTLETEKGYSLEKQKITALGCLVDIEITRNQLLHESKCLESPASFVQGVMSLDQQHYRSATLHLESSSSIGGGTTAATSANIPFPREALAGPDIMQTLCGGIDASELAQDKVLQESVYDLVQAMLREQVQLNWTIQMDCQPFRIEHVVLPPAPPTS